MKNYVNILVVCFVIITIFALFVSCRNRDSSETPGLTENQQLYVVSVKDLVKSVSVSGNLTYSNLEKMSFHSSGKVVNLISFDSEPLTIKKGELIASLDKESIAVLERALVQAEMDLNAANQKLNDFQNITSKQEINQANLDVTKAFIDLKNSEKELADLLSENPEKIQALKSVVFNQLALVKAKEAGVEGAKSYVTKMEAALATSESTYENALLVLDAKNKTLQNATLGYENVLQKWFGASVPDDSEYLNLSPKEVYEDLGVDLSGLYDRSARRLEIEKFKDIANPSSSKLDDWRKSPYDLISLSWLAWHPGLIIGVCETSEIISIGGFCVSREIDDAWILKQNANSDVNKQLSVVKSAKSEITTYQSNLLKSQTDLENVTNELEILKSDLVIAENELSHALDQINIDIEAQELKVKVQNDDLKAVESNVVFVTNKLELTKNLRESEVRKAQVSFDQSKENLKNSKIYAPFDGVLTMAVINEGSSVVAGQIIAQISSFDEMQFEGNVSESDVLLIQEGMSSEIEIDADQSLKVFGEVAHVSPKSLTDQGLITFPIEIPIDIPTDILLKEGMSAVAEVVLYKEIDRVLVPLDSVETSDGISRINVYTNETIEERIVELGGNDDFWVSILSGIEAGDKIVIESALTGTEEFEIDWED